MNLANGHPFIISQKQQSLSMTLAGFPSKHDANLSEVHNNRRKNNAKSVRFHQVPRADHGGIGNLVTNSK